MEGQCHLIVGCMFAGKSTELLRRLKRYELANRETLLLKNSIDVRYSVDKVVTHDKEERQARVVPSELTDELIIEISKSDFEVIGIDEGQFFHGIDKACQAWIDAGKIVIIAMLDSDYTGLPFPGCPLGELMVMSDTITKLTAICHRCGKEANFTQLITLTEMGDDHVKVGGKDTYQPSCRSCKKNFNAK